VAAAVRLATVTLVRVGGQRAGGEDEREHHGDDAEGTQGEHAHTNSFVRGTEFASSRPTDRFVKGAPKR